MDLRQYRYIVALEEERHFARAAQSLGITQSALTRSIQASEQALGLRLFDRGRDGVAPTRAGEMLVRDARDLLMRARTISENMALLADCDAGELAFGIGPLPGAMILADLLLHCARTHAGLRVRTRMGSAEELLDWLRSGEVEFIILSRGLLDTEADAVSVRMLGAVRLGRLVRKGHPLAGREVAAEDLRGFPVIGGAAPPSGRGTRQMDYGPSISCDNYDVLRVVCLRSDAIWIAAECLARDELVALRGPDFASRNPLAAASLAGRTLSPAAHMLIGEAARMIAGLRDG